MQHRVRRSIVPLFLGTVLIAMSSQAAWAAVITIPAITFAARGTAQGGTVKGFLASGGTPNELYTAPVSLPAGETICRFEMWARDNDGDFNVTGRLMRKRLFEGTRDNGFGNGPFSIANVSTLGGVMETVRLEDETILVPLVSDEFLFWVEIFFKGGNIDVLAVRITTAPACE